MENNFYLIQPQKRNIWWSIWLYLSYQIYRLFFMVFFFCIFAEKHGKTFIPPEVFFSCFLENVVIQKCPLFRFNITFMWKIITENFSIFFLSLIYAFNVLCGAIRNWGIGSRVFWTFLWELFRGAFKLIENELSLNLFHLYLVSFIINKMYFSRAFFIEIPIEIVPMTSPKQLS